MWRDVCEHREGANPRSEGHCVKCGVVMPEPLERDRGLEDAVLSLTTELCERVHSVKPVTFTGRVLARLEKGEQDYEGTWQERPEGELVVEAADEPADAAAWLLLYLQRLKDRLDTPAFLECQMVALDAMAYFAAGDDALNRLRVLVGEFG